MEGRLNAHRLGHVQYGPPKIHFFLWTNEKDDVIFKQILFGEGDLIKFPQLLTGKGDL